MYYKKKIMKINILLTFIIEIGKFKIEENLIKMSASVKEVDEEEYKLIFFFH